MHRPDEFFTMEYDDQTKARTGSPRLPWVLVLAFAGTSGWFARQWIVVRADVQASEAEESEPACVNEGAPPEAEQYAIIALLQAAKAQELEEEIAQLRRQARSSSPAVDSSPDLSRLRRENEKLERQCREKAETIKEWKKAGDQAAKEIERLRELVAVRDAEIERMRVILAELAAGKRNIVPTEFRARP